MNPPPIVLPAALIAPNVAHTQKSIAENERVRGTRLMLGPGESLPLHPSCGMLVALDGAQVRFRTGGQDEAVTLLARPILGGATPIARRCC
jgi:hypothetical protein